MYLDISSTSTFKKYLFSSSFDVGFTITSFSFKAKLYILFKQFYLIFKVAINNTTY